MLKNILAQFGKKGIYGLLGTLGLQLLPNVNHDIWTALAAGGFTGAVAVVWRLIRWDPSK